MRAILQDRTLLIFIGLTFAFLLASVILVYVYINNLSYPLVLHFNPYYGVDLMGASIDVWGIIIMGAVVIGVNMAVGAMLFYRERIMTHILGAVSVMVALLTLISVGNIIALN
ncbi:MAG TPA: hypothetical protein ENH86_02330 [Candidatus Jorgensenbacteria bacterium]|nr:hypothetical protein [Candidatus Jorgensenbacteria bacterium]